MPVIVDAPALPAAFTTGEVPIVCIAYAAAAYDLPTNLLLAVLKVEDGRVGMENRNSNGTHDLGPMQINTSWLPVLKQYGITREALRDDGCLNVWTGAWILRSAVNSTDSWWRGVGRYHSATMRAGRDLNGNYARRVSSQLQRIDQLNVSWWGIPGLQPASLTIANRHRREPRRNVL